MHQENTASFITLSLNSDKIRDCERSRETANLQLCLPLETPQQSSRQEIQSKSPCTKSEKPQIVSIQGVSMKERNRYRVMLAGQILGDRLAIDEALKLAKRGKR